MRKKRGELSEIVVLYYKFDLLGFLMKIGIKTEYSKDDTYF